MRLRYDSTSVFAVTVQGDIYGTWLRSMNLGSTLSSYIALSSYAMRLRYESTSVIYGTWLRSMNLGSTLS